MVTSMYENSYNSERVFGTRKGYIGIQDNIESPVYDCWFISHLFLVFFHMYVQLYVMFGIMYFV